jgi:hypothetical protein
VYIPLPVFACSNCSVSSGLIAKAYLYAILMATSWFQLAYQSRDRLGHPAVLGYLPQNLESTVREGYSDELRAHAWLHDDRAQFQSTGLTCKLCSSEMGTVSIMMEKPVEWDYQDQRSGSPSDELPYQSHKYPARPTVLIHPSSLFPPSSFSFFRFVLRFSGAESILALYLSFLPIIPL